jgi:hypothetical protein
MSPSPEERRVVRSIIWVLAIVAGIGAILASVLLTEMPNPVVVIVLVVATWTGVGMIQGWLLGIDRHVRAHVGGEPETWHLLAHPVWSGDRVNLQMALNRLQETATIGPFGLPGWNALEADAAGQGHALYYGNPEPAAINNESFPMPGSGSLACTTNALYLLRCEGVPFAAVVRSGENRGRKWARLTIAARTRAAAEAALGGVLKLAHEHSPYHGTILSIEASDRATGDYSVRFHELKAVPRSDIILPKDVLLVLERNIIGHFQHAEGLKRAGQGARHGVLLHGPPGTGKTLVTRHLARAVPGVTVVLLTGREYAHLATACRLARLFAPSLVVLEDVDLIATERKKNRHAPLLHELMDEMDGLGDDAAVVFLLTTNRPDVLEPALAARPGRVDQAVFFPLPDLDCRRRLFAHFARGLDLSGVDTAPLLAGTEGASPAFLKEMFRRAALMALERGASGQPLRMQQDDFRRALTELIQSGGELTRQFLGFPSTPGGSR